MTNCLKKSSSFNKDSKQNFSVYLKLVLWLYAPKFVKYSLPIILLNFVLGQLDDYLRINEVCLCFLKISKPHLDRQHKVTTMDRDWLRDTHWHMSAQTNITLKYKIFFSKIVKIFLTWMAKLQAGQLQLKHIVRNPRQSLRRSSILNHMLYLIFISYIIKLKTYTTLTYFVRNVWPLVIYFLRPTINPLIELHFLSSYLQDHW